MKWRSALILLCTSLPLAAQRRSDPVTAIGAEFRRINADSTLRSMTLENDDFIGGMDGGSALTGYFDRSGRLCKMVSWVGLSMGHWLDEYYLRDGRLLFVYSTFHSFVRDENGAVQDEKGTNRTFEGRYYFHQGRLIRTSASGTPEQQAAPGRFLLRNASSYAALLKRRAGKSGSRKQVLQR